MNIIQLTKGLVAIVDEDLWEELNKFSWYSSGVRGKEYAARRLKKYEDYTRPLIYLHHQVLNVKPWDFINTHVDHINRNRLDCRKSNLAITTPSSNQLNSDRVQNQKGIGRDRTHNTYKAYINIHNGYSTKRINIGTYKTYDEAFIARNLRLAELGLI